MNRNPILALVLVACLAGSSFTLSACQTTQQAQAHLTAARGLYVAELAYYGFANSVIAAAASGALTGDNLAKAKAAEEKAYEALQLARQGRASADGVTEALSAAPQIPIPGVQ